MASILLPSARAIYLCDDVVEHAGTENLSVLNVFNAIRPPEYPHRQSRICVFVQLADAEGRIPSRVEIQRSRDQAVIFATSDFALEFPDRLFQVRANFRILNCSFPEPGVYWVTLFCHGHYVADQTLKLLPPRGQSNGRER